jgi:hypothetical protein
MGILKQEKRRQKRFVKRCSVEFQSGGETYRGFSRNLSLDGLFLKSRKPLAPDTIIEMVVDLPDGSTAKLRGRVKRALRNPHSGTLERAGIPSKDGMGIEIIEQDSNYVKFITSFLSSPES